MNNPGTGKRGEKHGKLRVASLTGLNTHAYVVFTYKDQLRDVFIDHFSGSDAAIARVCVSVCVCVCCEDSNC